jgi:excisionase family DNA binding protein
MASDLHEPTAPTAEEMSLARDSGRALARHLDGHETLEIQILEDARPGETVRLPASAVRLLIELLTHMADGNAVTLIPSHAELTTQQAADLLNVSRQYFIDEVLEKGRIAYRKVGTHRRVRFHDLIAYKKRQYSDREAALDALTAAGEGLGLDY